MASTDLELIIKAQDKASKTLGDISKKAGGLAKVMGKAVVAGALAGGVALAGAGIAAVKMGLDFEKGLAEVKTLLPDITDEGFGELKRGVLDLSKELGIATSDAIPALYQAISAGVPPDNVLDFMRTAGKAAIGGVTELETAVDGITSVVNAYGAEAISAGAASDIMFTAVKLGKTNFEELSASLFNVLPTASSLGIGFEEVAAAMAVMTAQGVPTSVATTQLRQAFVEASKGGSKLDKAIREMAGKGLGDLVKGGATATGIFEELRQSMPEQDFRDLFGSVEAMNAVMQLTGPNAEAMADALDETMNSAGASEAAFDVMAKTASFKLTKAINLLKVTLTEVGIKILPALTAALSAAVPWLEKNLPKAVAFLEDAFAEIKPIILTVAGILGDTLVPAAKTLGRVLIEDVFPVLKKVFNFLRDNKEILLAVGIAIGVLALTALPAWIAATWANVAAHIALAWATLLAYAPILLLIAGIALLAFGVIQLIKHWDDVTAALGKFKDFVVEAFGSIKDKVLGIVNDVVDFLREHWKEIVTVALSILFPPAGGLFFIITHFGEIKEKVLGIVSGLKDTLVGLVTKLKDAVVGFFSGLKDDVIEIVTTLKTDVEHKIAELRDAAIEIVMDFKDRMMRGFGRIKDAVVGVITTLKTDVETKIAELRDKVIEVVAGIPGSIASLGKDFGKAAFGLGRDIVDGLKSGVETGLFIIKEAINSIIGLVEQGLNSLIGGINALGDAISAIPGVPGIPDIPPISIPRLEGGGEVLKSGLAVVHRGEVFSQGGGGSTTITINFTHNGILMGDEVEAERFTRDIGDRLRRQLRGLHA